MIPASGGPEIIHPVPVLILTWTATLSLQGSVATLFRWRWKILSYFVANLSKTLRINFYQNRSSIVEVMTKNFWCALCPTVYKGEWKLNKKHCVFWVYVFWRQALDAGANVSFCWPRVCIGLSVLPYDVYTCSTDYRLMCCRCRAYNEWRRCCQASSTSRCCSVVCVVGRPPTRVSCRVSTSSVAPAYWDTLPGYDTPPPSSHNARAPPP